MASPDLMELTNAMRLYAATSIGMEDPECLKEDLSLAVDIEPDERAHSSQPNDAHKKAPCAPHSCADIIRDADTDIT